MTLNLSPQVEARLAAAARQRGIDIEALVERLAVEHLPPLSNDVTITAEASASPTNLAEFLGDFIGCIHGTGTVRAENISKDFGDYLAAKHEENRL